MVDLTTEDDAENGATDNDTDLDENSIVPGLTERLVIAARSVPRNLISERSGVPKRTLSRYLRGAPIKLRALIALAEACNVSLEWLATGKGDMPGEMISMHSVGNEDQPVTTGDLVPGYVPIPRWNVSASAGGGAPLAEHPQVVEFLAFAESFLRLRLHRKGEELGLIEARGDSMEPTIRDGDVLTVDIRPNQAPQNGRLYVIRNGDALVVKRLELRIRSIVLHSDNPRYQPETLDRTDTDQIHIIGQVILVTSPPR